MSNQEIYASIAASVSYDPETGLLKWKRREELTRVDKNYNAQFAGHECGSVDSHGYRVISYSHNGSRRILKAHRLAWFIVHGVIPEGDIDHVNRNRADNRFENLRAVSRSINNRNSSMHRHNTSGVTGVYFDKQTGKWRANASVDGRTRHIGYFTCIHAAAAAIKNFRVTHGFTESHGMS